MRLIRGDILLLSPVPYPAGGAESSLQVEHVTDAPQQRNGYDCGMYTVLLAEHLASRAAAHGDPTPGGDPHENALGGDVKTLADAINPKFVSRARSLALERLLQCVRSRRVGGTGR